MRYFVKLAGKAFGPLEEEKILEMYQAGRLKDPVEISRDKKAWDSIDSILPPPPPPDLPPVEPYVPAPVESFASDPVDLYVPSPVTEEITQKFVDPSSPVWCYSADGSNGYGPVTKSDLATMLQCGMLKSSSLVWRQGENNTRPISAVPELIDVLHFAASQSSSAGYGGDANSVPPIPDNPSYNDAFSSNSMKSSGLGAFNLTSTGSRAHSNTNMFDLLDDPDFGTDGLGQGGAYEPSQVGQTNRMSYVLMAIFFGQLGIHNFYASRMDIGIVQLFIGLSNLVGFIIISIVSLATEGAGRFLLIIPTIIGFGLELWAIIEACVVIKDGTGRRMY